MNPDKLYRSVNDVHYRQVISDAKMIIRNAIDRNGTGNIAVAVSGGKDSTAMAHLVRQYCEPIMLWNDSGLELPESKDVIQKLSDMLKCRIIIAKGDAISAWQKNMADGKTDVDQTALFGPSQQAIKDNGISLEFVGLREDEAKARKMLLRSRGAIFQNKRWGCMTAFPMRKWKSEDCLAYIDEHNLPLHPAYTRTEWKEREKIRVSWVYDDRWESEGQSEYCRKYYPKIYRQLKDIGIIK